MKKKKKVNKKKLLSRIIILLIIIFAIISVPKIIAKKENNISKTRVIVDKEDITDKLLSDIYIDKDLRLYMSMKDIKNIFDKNIIYEEETGKIITTSDTKVGAIDVNNNNIELNTAVLSLQAGIINYEESYYLPVSELCNIYNIEVKTTENSAVISSMYKELTTVETIKDISLKEKPGAILGKIQKINKQSELIFIENSEKNGWIKVITYEGNIGYIQEKNITKKEQKRIDMHESDFSSKTTDMEKTIVIDNKKLNEENLKDFNTRKKIIEETISEAISNEKYTVDINLKEANLQEKYLKRFIIELKPRLREIGGNIAVTNNEILNSEFLSENGLI